MLIIVMLFLSLIVYQKTMLGYLAASIAEKTAYSWNNSYKQPETGAFSPGQQDGLYWRVFQDGGLNWLGLHSSERFTVSLPVNEVDYSKSLVITKLERSVLMLPDGMSGHIRYDASLIERKVTVQLAGRLKLPQFMQIFFKSDGITARAEATISEPVDLIRNVNMLRTYAGELVHRITKSKVISIIQEPISTDSKAISTTNHKEAVAYLRKITGGEERKLTLGDGTVRVVDAIDRQGMAHQAYYTFSERQIRIQMAKDQELLRIGEIRGVIWHFFASDSRMKPSQALHSDLTKNGMIVIIHQ